MKQYNLLSMVAIAVLMVFGIGCTTLSESTGYEEVPRRGVYRQAPYGNNNIIVVERDPFTGRYYDVSPYGGYYGAPYYGRRAPVYRTVPAPRNNGRYTNPGGNIRNNNNNRPAPRAQQQTPPQRRGSETTDQAKDILRGKQ